VARKPLVGKTAGRNFNSKQRGKESNPYLPEPRGDTEGRTMYRCAGSTQKNGRGKRASNKKERRSNNVGESHLQDGVSPRSREIKSSMRAEVGICAEESDGKTKKSRRCGAGTSRKIEEKGERGRLVR